ncbi:MAG: cation transporter [Pseudomonadales bacterium]|nr:cation transporter [Pseudomonadales bacterium]
MSSHNTESGNPHSHDNTGSGTHDHQHDHASSHHDHTDGAVYQELIIEGAGCASCVGKIESALKAVEGVKQAEMNFAQRTVNVSGTAPAEQLIKAVEEVGYNAKMSAADNDDDALEEKEKADWAYYKRLMREMTIALLLGVPLMIYASSLER